jgi:hypothetical protein
MLCRALPSELATKPAAKNFANPSVLANAAAAAVTEPLVTCSKALM